MENTAPQLTQPAVHNNAMDLLSICQHNPTHHKNCPHPDKHPLSIYSAYPASNITPLTKSESTAVSEGSCLPSPGFLEKGVSLA
ncbi:hypothetical protein BDW72DRAFT_182573 [Aspergillus terricola var. indicus]